MRATGAVAIKVRRGGMMGTHVLAIDAGTTSTRSLVIDPEGRVCASALCEITQYFPEPGWVEHDPEEIWRSVVTTMRAALDTARLRPHDLAAVGITNQRETIVCWDRVTGAAQYRALVWQDRRTTSVVESLQRDGRAARVQALTGLHLDPYFSAAKIAWILDHVPGLRARALRGDVYAGTIDSWLLWRLSGGRVHATDPTNASRTSLMDLARVAWDDELCGLFDVPRDVLPTIMPSGSDFAETDADVLGESVLVAGILGDQQAALLGQGCVRAGQTKNTYGTGSFILQHTGEHALTETGSLLATAAATSAGSPQQYALEGSIFVTGAALQWLRDTLGIIETAGESESLAASLSDNGDVWFVPALTGLGAPWWDPHARGTLVGLTRGTTRAHVARAALESIAFQTRDVLEAMNRHSRVSVEELRVDGGGTANRWLMQFQSDVLGVAVVVAPHAQATALGAALCAGVHAGVFSPDDDVVARLGAGERYEPRMSVDQADALQARWRRALERSRDWAS